MPRPIEPYKRFPKPVELGMLTDTAMIVSERSERPRKTAPPGVQIYADAETVTKLVREGCGELLAWSGQPVKWRRELRDEEGWTDRPDDVIVLPMRFPVYRQRTMRGLQVWRDWLAAHRAQPGRSLGSSAWSLLRATLRQPVFPMRGEVPPVEWVVLGPRQLLAPWVPDYPTYRNAIHYDLPAAYPTVQATLPYNDSAIWRMTDEPREVERWVDFKRKSGSAEPMLVEATVRIPELPIGPLPKRPPAELMRTLREDDIARCEVINGRAVTRYPSGRTLRGIWSHEELEEATCWGCEVEQLHAVWALLSTPGPSPFLPWYDAVLRGRELEVPFARTLAKATAISCWGRMIPNPNNIRFRVRASGRVMLPPRPGVMPQYWDAAELITAGVRVKALRMMRELGPRLLTFHTDGGFATGGELLPGWEVKHVARKLQLIDQQQFKQWLAGRGKPSYTLAGVPRGEEPGYWNSMWKGEGSVYALAK
jgi:hypothetical protein